MRLALHCQFMLLVEVGVFLKEGDSAMMMAVAEGNLHILKELIRAGADLNLQNEVNL